MSSKSAGEIVPPSPKGHSRMFGRSFEDLRKSFRDVQNFIQRCSKLHSMMFQTSFKDLQDIIHGAPGVCWFGVNVTARVEHYARELMLAMHG
jgi:hypothetical protein